MDMGFRVWASRISEEKFAITLRDRGKAQQQLREKKIRSTINSFNLFREVGFIFIYLFSSFVVPSTPFSTMPKEFLNFFLWRSLKKLSSFLHFSLSHRRIMMIFWNACLNKSIGVICKITICLNWLLFLTFCYFPKYCRSKEFDFLFYIHLHLHFFFITFIWYWENFN